VISYQQQSQIDSPRSRVAHPSGLGNDTEFLSQLPRLLQSLDRVRDICRYRHYSIRTEDAYAQWIRRYILFHGKKHPEKLGEDDVRAFLTHLAVKGKVAASTQNQALSALLFLYDAVLHQPLGWVKNVERAKRPIRLPVVLTREEVQAVLGQLTGTYRLMANLLYGSGLRLMDCVRLRLPLLSP